MSSLDKLAIRGIRSFDPNDVNVLQFFSPLTLIVGQNGSGKTTIIECLKYITTGDMPPNSKGGAFVHDPGMVGETTVNAEVKLRFKNTAGDQMVADRRLQVSKKKAGGLTFKTLEGTLSYADAKGDGNKRASISTKCSELDDEVPLQLGVSKAILENVIFCHQEESNWPLSEPALLKKKFDEIFEASKYTKALDQIKAIRKEQAVDLKVDRERLSALKTDRERANKLQAAIAVLETAIEAKLAEHGALEADIRTQGDKNKEFYKGATEHTEIVVKHNALIEKVKVHEAAAERLRQSLTESLAELSDEDLKIRLDSHGATLEAGQKRLREQQGRLSQAEASFQELQTKQLRQQADLGRAQGDQQNLDRALEARMQLARQLGAALALADSDLPQNGGNVDAFLRSLNSQHADLNRALETVRAEGDAAVQSKTDEIVRLRAEQSGLENSKNAIRERMVELRKKSERLNSQIQASPSSETDIQEMDDKVKAQQEQLAQLSADFKAAKYDDAIRARASKIGSIDFQRESLHGEMAGLNRQGEKRARLDVKRADLLKSEKALQEALTTNGALFKKYAGKDVVADTLESDVSTMAARKMGDLQAAERTFAMSSRDTQKAEVDYNNNQAQLASLEQQLVDRKKRIAEVTDSDSDGLEQLIKEAREEVDTRRSDISNYDFSQSFFNSMMSHGEKTHACTACMRPFTKDGDLAKFKTFCNDQIRKAPQKKQEAVDELPEWEDELKKLTKVQPEAIACKQLVERDIPAARAALQRSQAAYETAKARKDEDEAAHKAAKAVESDMQALKRFVGDISRSQATKRELAREIDTLEKDLEITGATKTMEDLEKELSEAAGKLEEERRAQRNLEVTRVEKTQEMQTLEKAVLSGQLKIQQLRSSLSTVTGLRTQLEDVRKEITDKQEQSKALDAKIADCTGPLDKAEEERKALSIHWRQQRTTAGDELRKAENGLQDMERAAKEIHKYRATGSDASIKHLESELSHVDDQLRSLQKSINETRRSIESLKDEASRAGATKRNLTDNIEMRKHKADMASIRSQAAALNLEEAEKMQRKFHTEYNEARQRLANMSAKQARLGGEIETSRHNLDEKRHELMTEYKDIHDSYRSQLIKVKVGELSNADLEKYGKALDTAIMKYHEHKMREINDSIQALWSKTYQGTDVDTIMIKSDNENAKGNRTYNYRVVMLKDKVELDMRGRCSAGQKVLASIIIRLALAESFGTNCGVLALDEPTTNLDRDNVKALAQALSDIVKERRAQHNLQLIVITHDEDLLSLLGDSIERYWRVSRSDRQKSRILRQRVDR